MPACTHMYVPWFSGTTSSIVDWSCFCEKSVFHHLSAVHWVNATACSVNLKLAGSRRSCSNRAYIHLNMPHTTGENSFIKG